ncbi:antirestriction protein ArdC [Bradyrhizobium sp. i1.4.4]
MLEAKPMNAANYVSPWHAKSSYSCFSRIPSSEDRPLLPSVLPRSGFVQCALCRYRHNGHASGHPARLNRDLSGGYGTKKYAFEELIAEISSAFSCASLGIVPTVRHADYIGSWLEVLRDDNRAIVRAASQASKVADYLLGFLPEVTVDMTEERAEQEAA